MNVNAEINVLFKNRNYDELLIYVQNTSKHFKSLLSKCDLEELEKELEIEKARCAYYIKKEYYEQNIDFIFGKYVGELESICDRLNEKFEEAAINDAIYKNDVAEIPHVNDIISTIYHDEGIRHGVLAEKVGIDRSTLTGIMDKLVKKQIVIFSRPGKFKYYYLSKAGKKYYATKKYDLEANKNTEASLEQLLINISKESNQTKAIQNTIQAIFEQNSKIQEYDSNKKQKLDPTSLLIYFANQNPMNVMLSNSNEIHRINKTFNIRENMDRQILVFCENSNDNDSTLMKSQKYVTV